MIKQRIEVAGIPVIIWGDTAEAVYLYIHGKQSCKENAEGVAQVAVQQGAQVLSFDLPRHGERAADELPFDVWNGTKELEMVMQYVQENWSKVSLVANSIGAYFSLLTYSNIVFEQVLFISPIVDMEQLITTMMGWFHIDESQLREQEWIELPNQLDPLDWNYYCYVKRHPIQKWSSPTSIFYGAKDELQAGTVIQNFAEQFNCELKVLENGSHALLEAFEVAALNEWLREKIISE